eukprot:29017-Pelagococcus_subviridis.AAC.4
MPCSNAPTAGQKIGSRPIPLYSAISGRCLCARLKPYAPHGSASPAWWIAMSCFPPPLYPLTACTTKPTSLGRIPASTSGRVNAIIPVG